MTIHQRTLFFSMISFILIVLAIQLAKATDPHSSEWRKKTHEWRKQGRCLECHHDHAQKTRMRPPDYHTAQFRNATHGRTPNLTPNKCYGCHEIQTCQTCHRRKPTSHTESFINPVRRSGTGLTRHLLMGRLRPSSCLICHQSFISTCTSCHTPSEVTLWEEHALPELIPWKALYDAHP